MTREISTIVDKQKIAFSLQVEGLIQVSSLSSLKKRSIKINQMTMLN